MPTRPEVRLIGRIEKHEDGQKKETSACGGKNVICYRGNKLLDTKEENKKFNVILISLMRPGRQSGCSRVDIHPSRTGLGIFKVSPEARMCTEAEDSLRVPGRQTGDHSIQKVYSIHFSFRLVGKHLSSFYIEAPAGRYQLLVSNVPPLRNLLW